MLKTLATILLAGLAVTSSARAAPPASGDETSLPSKTQLKRAVSAALQAEARERRQRKLSDDGVANEAYAQAVLQLCDAFADPTSPSVSPSSESAAMGAAGGGVIDNGWQLVELIQQTIEPGFWDTTGGPGTIYYFALKRALVVRATSEVHVDLGNTLQQLKRN